MFFRSALYVILVLILSITQPITARVINIPDDQETIQNGIDTAEDGDTVLVQPGTYTENINFEGKAITVGSLYLTTCDTAFINSTIIDGDRNGRSVVVFRNHEEENSLITGFTIQNGETDYGGGIYINGSGPMISYMIIRDNTVSEEGGGIYCTNTGRAMINNVLIIGNQAYMGGGLCCYNNSEAILFKTIIRENNTEDSAGGIQCSRDSRLLLNDVTIIANECGYQGPGIWCSNSSVVIISNCVIATFNEGYFIRAILNCQVSMINVTCYSYGERQTYLARISSGSDLNLTNCILSEGNGIVSVRDSAAVNISYSNVPNGHESIYFDTEDNVIWGDGNIDDDPQFVDPDNYDFHLTEDSPCIDAGNPDSDSDPDGTRADMGAYYFHQRDIEIESDELQFEDVQTGTIDSLALVINNVGLSALRITSIWIAPVETPFYISWEREFPDIEPEGSYTEWIKFAPGEEDEFQAVLTIESDDPDEESLEIRLDGTSLHVADDENQAPRDFAITSAYPNPFNSETVINYSIALSGNVTIGVYDLSGREIASLCNGHREAGEYSGHWNANGVSTGMYICRLTCNNQSGAVKLVVVR
jgi:hypothetical protein